MGLFSSDKDNSAEANRMAAEWLMRKYKERQERKAQERQEQEEAEKKMAEEYFHGKKDEEKKGGWFS
ncbi:MAG: hypothetical protein GC129_03390 [Proteobacteria bacterium]|nr:hypothetical protein [Pseudomonadota bacterium]